MTDSPESSTPGTPPVPSPILARIDALVKSDKVVLFMKGTRAAPQCGFSATVVNVLDQYVPSYTTVNVLADPELRDGIKQYANWPTIPQLFVGGEFIGGADIVRELEAQGDLVAALGDAASAPKAPNVTITAAAVAVFEEALADTSPDERLRLVIDANFQHDLAIDVPHPSDVVVRAGGLEIVLDPGSARRAEGLVIDHVTEPDEGFRIENPNSPLQVRQVSPSEAKALIESEPEARFYDVRTPSERARAKIEGTTLLEGDVHTLMHELPKDTLLVFHCHHGMRSYQAAVHFLEHGFTRVYNVQGGIDAWSRDLDPAIPRY